MKRAVGRSKAPRAALRGWRGATGAALEKICARFRGIDRSDGERRSVRKRQRPDGTVAITVTLEPDEAERVWQALRETKLALASESAGEHAPPTMAHWDGTPANISGAVEALAASEGVT